jgi:hypothetical protein
VSTAQVFHCTYPQILKLAKQFKETNTLAYLPLAGSLTKQISFIRLTARPNVIKLFTDVIYDFFGIS